MKRVLLLLFIALPASADSPWSLLGGRVRSEGVPAPDVAVTVRSDALLMPRTTVTASDGRYWVAALPPGEYEITFSREGLQTVTRHVRLHAAEQARVDAVLAPSAEGESVTLTAATRSVFERPERPWSLHRDAFELLPHARDGASLIALAPEESGRLVRAPRIDSLADEAASHFEVPDALLEASVHGGGAVLVTRSAIERAFATLRATYDEATRGVHAEVTAGTPLGSRASLFAAGATGDRRTLYAKGVLAPVASHATTISWLSRASGNRFAIDHVAAFSPNVTLAAAHSRAGTRHTAATLFAFAAGHELSMGGSRTAGRDIFFIDDRWIVTNRWAVNASVRYDDGHTAPRLALIRHFGRDRYIAQWSDSDWMLAYGRQLTGDGYARVALLREEERNRIVVDAMHDYLFLTFGGNATAGDGIRHANAWLIVVPPMIDRRVLVALAARYRDGATATDVALTYGFTFTRLEPFVKLEFDNVFDTPRGWRIGAGIRFE